MRQAGRTEWSRAEQADAAAGVTRLCPLLQAFLELNEGVRQGRQNTAVGNVCKRIGVVKHEEFEIGPYISFAELTKPMRKEAAEPGSYLGRWISIPRLLLLTIRSLIDNFERLERPLHVRNVTLKAPRTRPTPLRKLTLDLGS